MRVVFMGATDLGWRCCRHLLDIGQELAGIFTIPREFRISWSQSGVTNVQFASFEDLAEEAGVPLVHVTGHLRDQQYEQALRRMEPDLLVVAGWYYLVPRS